VEAHAAGRGPIKIKRRHRLAHVGAQFVPAVGLREDAFAQRLGHEASVALLGDFKNEFVHGVKLRRRRSLGKRGVVSCLASTPGTPRNAAITTEVSSTRSPVTRIIPLAILFAYPFQLLAVRLAQDRGAAPQRLQPLGAYLLAQTVNQRSRLPPVLEKTGCASLRRRLPACS
jgi:hypothetical protein